MWLGTFETAEEAARAYDEATCILRGSNTRTNFITHVPLDSSLASRIRNLLNNRNGSKPSKQDVGTSSPTVDTSATSYICSSRSSVSNENSASNGAIREPQLFDEAHRQALSKCSEKFDSGSSQSNISWSVGAGFGRFLYAQEALDLPKNVALPGTEELEISEFARMKVERQISASLYAINGVQECMQIVQDSSEPLWDLPPLCSLFCYI